MRGIGMATVIILAIALLGVVGLVNRGCNTASEMADQTVFNASKNVWSYEQFHQKFEQFQQYQRQLADAESRKAALEKNGVVTGQEHDNLVMEISGTRQMMYRLASDYNAMSEIAYQGIWKSRGLPGRLDVSTSN